ncbi:MAG: hypothetical protein Hens2KO_24750 [Henriciella sp.]
MKKSLGLIAISALALAACDAVRVPGDGREAPEPAPPIPDGAPGPAPPMVPVTDPWNEGDDTPVDETPVDEPETPETPIEPVDPAEPVEGETDPDPAPAPTDGEPVDPDPVDPEPTDPDPVDPDPVDPEDAAPADPGEPEEPEPEPEPETPVSPPLPPAPVKFEYYAPGNLIPGTGFGRGDDTVYAPNMLFPIKSAPTFPQSMVYRAGGAVGGDQCDASNYATPWRDNFCETRSSNRNTPLCPTNKVHQGQDIRVGTASDCNALRGQSPRDRGLHEVIAVEDGIIQHIGTYSVKLKGTETGNIYSYLHLNMRRLRVSALDTVEAGDTIGFVSNDFGGTPTTFHLHFEMKAPIEGEGIVHVPPYMSLVAAYERREEGVGLLVEDDLVAVASVPVIVDPSKLIE